VRDAVKAEAVCAPKGPWRLNAGQTDAALVLVIVERVELLDGLRLLVQMLGLAFSRASPDGLKDWGGGR
jgi:hypothetical protein